MTKTPAQQAYQNWKLSHKLQLRAHTEEELFCIGYEIRDEEVEHLESVVDALVRIMQEDGIEAAQPEQEKEPEAKAVPKPKKAKKNEEA